MTRLTEDMVIARAKTSDLGQIRKLNCWGSGLSDVSIVERMTSVEVLALSVNSIGTLAPFKECTRLQELYLRKNDIKDINQLIHLQGLKHLRYLWLEENPLCAACGSNYRYMILRYLPNLKKLDNVEVTDEDLEQAQRLADYDSSPYSDEREQADDVQDDDQADQHYQQQLQQQQQQQQQLYQQQQYQQPQSTRQPSQQQYVSNSPPRPYAQSPQKESSPVSDEDQTNRVIRAPIPGSVSAQSIREYSQTERPSHPAAYRHSQTDLTEWEEQHNSSRQGSAYGGRSERDRESDGQRTYRSNGSAAQNGDWDDAERQRVRRLKHPCSESVSSIAAYNHPGYFGRRPPVSRNSNLLSAALCLVKELDYTSLEVMEHAVRCRLDELADD